MMGVMGESSEYKDYGRIRRHDKDESEHKREVEAFLFDLQCVFFESDSTVSTDFFIEALRYWDPEHLDEVISERNANAICGWPLCTQPNLRSPGRFKITSGQLHETTHLNRFCSVGCGKMAGLVMGRMGERRERWRNRVTGEVVPAWKRIGRLPDGGVAGLMNSAAMREAERKTERDLVSSLEHLSLD